MTKARELLTAQTQADLKRGADEETAAANRASAASFNPQPVGGDIQKGTGTPGGLLKTANFEPEPNIMGDYFQSTYHFSFYLDQDIEAEQGKGNHFVIAQSGLTGMNIQSVDIDGFVGANIRTRNATATNITMKIFEPFGSQFPDLLFQAAVKMNIRNYLKAPWFLELKLHGYDENGVKQAIGDGWKWKMVLIDVQSQISENGSLHTVTAMPQNEVALNNQYCMLPNSVNSTGSTVGEVLQNIVKSMNESVTNDYGATNPPVIEYEIRDEPYPYDTKVGINKPFDHRIVGDAPQDENGRSAIAFGEQNTHFAPGTDIPAVLDMLLARTNTGIQISRVSREAPSTSGPDLETTIRDPASFMHRVDTHVEYKDYNAVVGDYCKKITFIVKPYQTVRLLTSMGRAMTFDREKTLNIEKARHAIKQVMMKKQYDYIFTGMNTEVEKFDINLNFRWAVSVPVMQGWTTNTGTTARVDNAASAQEHRMQLQANKNKLDAVAVEEANATEAVKQAERDASTNGTQVDPQLIANRDRLRQEYATLKQQNAQLGTIAAAETDAINKRENEIADKRRKANPIQGPIIDGEDDIYEHAQSDGEGNADTGYGGAGSGDLSYMPITVVSDPDQLNSVSTGTSNDNNANKSVYGALLNQLYGSMDGNLQSIELDIRGDPYWLGPGNYGEPYNEPSTDTKPNFMNGEHMFVFRFKLPQGYDQNTGTVSVAKDDQAPGGSSTGEDKGKPGSGGNSNIFTGFYAVTQVTNHFREGYFSQTLNAVRIQGWTYENIIEGREVTVEDNTIYSNTKAPVVSNPAPSGSTETGNRGSGGGAAPNPRGNSRGDRNNNPGNLRASDFAKRQPGYVGADSSNFAQFSSREAGIRAQETLLLHNYVQNPTTVTAVIDRYLGKNVPGNINSPASRNNYIKYVQGQLGKSNIGPSDASALAAAMRRFETGAR